MAATNRAFEPRPPDAVVFVQTPTRPPSSCVACAASGVPVIAFGVGSSVEGHLLAVEGGVCIDFSQMNQVLRPSAPAT